MSAAHFELLLCTNICRMSSLQHTSIEMAIKLIYTYAAKDKPQFIGCNNRFFNVTSTKDNCKHAIISIK